MKPNLMKQRLFPVTPGVTGLMATWIALILLMASSVMSSLSAQTIQSLDAQKASMEPSTAEHLQSLVTDLLPSVFLMKGETTTYGSGDPLIVYCDAASVNLLYENNPLFKNAIMLRMKINAPGELPSSLDIARLASFDNLNYVFFMFTYDVCGNLSDECLASALSNVIVQSNTRGAASVKQASPQISVVYQLSMIQ